MVVKVILFLVFLYCDNAEAVRCRRCVNARSLDDCTTQAECSEECYMDKYVTSSLSTVFYGGCRSKNTCQTGVGLHLPTAVQSVNCSSCCDTNTTNGVECNVGLCGIKASRTGLTQCYSCNSDGFGGQGDVDDPKKCISITSCPMDQVCGSQIYSMAASHTYRFRCVNKRLCTLLTQRALEDMRRCKDPAHIATGQCANLKRSGMQMCTACCGDDLCNHASCFDVLDRLYQLWQAGALDFHTLKSNTSSPITSIVG